MSKDQKNPNPEEEEEKRPEGVMNAYRDRLKILRHAQEYSQGGEIPKAVEKYNQYLAILATYHKTDEPKLSPKHFNAEKEITEMLLISHAYWDLAKAYDRSPRLQKECVRCLQQFITFSLGHKFQHVNAQMLKKFVKSRKAHNKKAFQQALDRLNVESKSCYIATFAFPNDEYKVLTTLRDFKFKIAKFDLGQKFINFYYDISPYFVKNFEENPILGKPVNIIILRPVIFTLAKLIQIFRK